MTKQIAILRLRRHRQGGCRRRRPATEFVSISPMLTVQVSQGVTSESVLFNFAKASNKSQRTRIKRTHLLCLVHDYRKPVLFFRLNPVLHFAAFQNPSNDETPMLFIVKRLAIDIPEQRGRQRFDILAHVGIISKNHRFRLVGTIMQFFGLSGRNKLADSPARHHLHLSGLDHPSRNRGSRSPHTSQDFTTAIFHFSLFIFHFSHTPSRAKPQSPTRRHC